MDRSKYLEYFDATQLHADIHIVGCGAIGSHIAEQLTRMGCENIHLWDMDTVSPHNIANQMFMEEDIGHSKTGSTALNMITINHEIEPNLTLHNKGWKNELLNGYVFLCVDNIDLRREIIKANQYNPNCIAFFDFRMRLTDAQHYMAIRSDAASVGRLLATMDFSHEEAKDATPKSACGTELSVVYTVKTITALGVSNFVKLTLGKTIKEVILIDMNALTLYAFPLDKEE